MSVLIKGMEMPKTCIECPMQFGGMCYVQPPEIDEPRVAPTVDQCVSRTSWCPLVEVPPHGRLIDADIMIKRYEPDMNRRIYGGNFIFDLEYAPTVIPADKDGET